MTVPAPRWAANAREQPRLRWPAWDQGWQREYAAGGAAAGGRAGGIWLVAGVFVLLFSAARAA